MQTRTICHTVTQNGDRGTFVYMAPELLSRDVAQYSFSQLKKADIWSYGMVLYVLLNPDQRYPFQSEFINQGIEDRVNAKSQIIRWLSQNIRPKQSSTYRHLQATEWIVLDGLYERCANFNVEERPSAEQVSKILEEDGNALDCTITIPLKVSQNSALEQADKNFAEGGIYQELTNDASNSCAFLSIIIAEKLLHLQFHSHATTLWKNLGSLVEDVICSAPAEFNKFRDPDLQYHVEEAHDLIMKNCPLRSRLVFTDMLKENHDVYSKEGRAGLTDAINSLGNEENSEISVALFSCGGYIFTVAVMNDAYVVLETHPICEILGGNKNGAVKVFPNARHLCRWIWKRLNISGVKESLQNLLLVKQKEGYPFHFQC